MSPLREVVESPRFTQEKRILEPDVRRIDEALDDLVWTLARRPELGVPFADTALWAYPVYPRGGRGFVVYYRFDDEQVTLESIVLENSWT